MLLLMWAAAWPAGCERSDPPTVGPATRPAAQVAVTNAYLAAAVRDLLGEQSQVIALAGPGSCPGHFDLRPQQVVELRQCRLLLRFDFQTGLEERLQDLSADGLRIAAVAPPGGLCLPSTYLEVVRQTADRLMQAGVLDAAEADRRVAAVTQRMADLQAELRGGIKDRWHDATGVVCSGHQNLFLVWLGVPVLATFSGAERSTPGEISRAIRESRSSRTGVVVGNAPEGRQLADALGESLGWPVVVFDNFPGDAADGPAFDAMVRRNAAALTEVLRDSSTPPAAQPTSAAHEQRGEP